MSAPPRTNVPGKPSIGSARSPGQSSHSVLVRAMNEEVARLSDSLAFEELELVCECERGDCLHGITVSRDAYEAVRRFPTRFLLESEHLGADDRVVEQTDGYVVVEKVGPDAASAILSDPRRDAA